MYERILRRFRKQVRRGEYVMTVHAEEEMAEDGSGEEIEIAAKLGPAGKMVTIAVFAP